MMRDHEKFIAFCLLGGALVGLSCMVYLKPPSPAITENGAAFAMLNTIIGALVLAFGGAANALFKITSAERKEIGEATALELRKGPPMQTEVVNTEDKPVPTVSEEELPPYAR